MATFNYSFTTKLLGFGIPPTFTEEPVLTSLPAGWTNQIFGTGSNPTFAAGGMTTNPGASGQSFIQQTSAGLNFSIGFLIDVVAAVPPASVAPVKKMKVVEVFKNGEGLASVFVDFTNNEIWLGDAVGVTSAGFRAGVKNDSVNFRLSVKGINTEFIARLYSAQEVSTTRPILQQTLGPSLTLGTTEDLINVGSLDSGDADVLIKSIKILKGADPDVFYNFPTISSIKPTSGVVTGGESFEVKTTLGLNTTFGSDNFSNDERVVDDSTGSASVSVVDNEILLSLTGIGTAQARHMNTFSGDNPPGCNLTIGMEVDSARITNPPQVELVLGAFEFRAGGHKLIAELRSNSIDGVRFNLVLDEDGTIALDKDVLTTANTTHTFNIIRAKNMLEFSINNQTVLKSVFPPSAGILAVYAKSTVAETITTKFSDLRVRPILLFGDVIGLI